jgi:hypothetical protein
MEDCIATRDPRGEIGPPTVVTDSLKVGIRILFYSFRSANSVVGPTLWFKLYF